MDLCHRKLFIFVASGLRNIVASVVVNLRRVSSDVSGSLFLLFLSLLSDSSPLSFALSQKIGLFLAVDLKMITPTIKTFQSHLRCNTSQNTVCYDSNSLTKNVSFFHRVSCQNNCSLSFESSKYIPKLSSAFRIKACGWFIKINYLWIRN